MSWEATAFADSLPFDIAKPLATRVLFKLGNVANPEGRNAFRKVRIMADELGVDERSVRRALRELEGLNLITPGDQRMVSHLPGNTRPTVYDLNMGWHREFGTPELPLPEEDENPDVQHTLHGGTQLLTGGTQFSTLSTGGTEKAFRGDTDSPPKNERTLTTTSKEKSSSPNRGRARESSANRWCMQVAQREHRFDGGRYCATCGMRRDGAMPSANGEYPA